MDTNNLRIVSAWLVTGLALGLAGCDPVRPGGFSGSFPGAFRIEVPQTPDFAAAASVRSSLNVQVRAWWFRAPREWHGPPPALVTSSAIEDGKLPALVDADVWPELAGTLDAAPRWIDGSSGPSLVAGIVEVSVSSGAAGTAGPTLLAADVEHVLFVASADQDVRPVGPAGPIVRVTRGFHLYERTAGADGEPAFEEVPLDTTLHPVQVGWVDLASEQASPDPAVVISGIGAATLDLGTVAAPIPADAPLAGGAAAPPLHVAAFAWSPGADDLYFLAAPPPPPPSGVVIMLEPYLGQVGHLPVGGSATTPIISDDLAGPLAVATGGTSLLVSIRRTSGYDYVRQSLSAALLPLQVRLSPEYAGDFAGMPLSPDGNLQAYLTRELFPELALLDLRTLDTSAVPLTKYPASAGWHVIPRAWAPDGRALLVETSTDSYAKSTARLLASLPLALDGGALPIAASDPVPFPAVGVLLTSIFEASEVRYFWSASGPGVLFQGADGTRVHNFATGQTTTLVAADRVAAPGTAIDVVVGADQAFAWSVQCFGLAETGCHSELRRLSLATGTIDVVATADEPRVFAVSPDGRRIALADDTNMYFKPLTP